MNNPKWANIGEDAGSMHALLERIAERVPVAAIDTVWIFPPRKIAIGESIVVVVAGFAENDEERRRVFTAHFTIARTKKGEATVTMRFDEHASAPVTAVPRIMQGVLRRLGEDIEASPREEAIAGDQDRWDTLIVDLGGRPRVIPNEPSQEVAAERSEEVA
jgi:hypothetical protein